MREYNIGVSKVSFRSFSGIVIKQDRSRVSEVYSTRDILPNADGHRQASVHTDVVTSQSMWLRFDEGNEVHYQFEAERFAVLEGHRVSVVEQIVKRPGQGDIAYDVRVINHSTGENVNIAGEHAMGAVTVRGALLQRAWKYVATYVAPYVVGFLLLAYLTDYGNASIVWLLGGLVFLAGKVVWSEQRRIRLARQALNQETSAILQLYAQTNRVSNGSTP